MTPEAVEVKTMTDSRKHIIGHTPAPWKVANAEPIMIVGGPAERYVCTVQVRQMGGGVVAALMEPEREANARLIQAAPDMLALLQQINDWHEGDWRFSSRVRAVLRKAKGEQEAGEVT